ncbi:Probable calcium-binding protein CML15 [Linum perenne]
MDLNGNGFFEFDEFVAPISNDIDEKMLTNQDHLLEIFQLFDRDWNVVITKADLVAAMAKMRHGGRWVDDVRVLDPYGLTSSSKSWVRGRGMGGVRGRNLGLINYFEYRNDPLCI